MSGSDHAGEAVAPVGAVVHSDVPVRLDRLAWSRWHLRVVLALGITWILDGLEASLIASLGPRLQDPRALGLTAADVGLANGAYLLGQVVGALGFGYWTDRRGRKRLFLVTLALYLTATAASGLSPNLAVFVCFRALAGAGIGGEYAAINSAIDELIPARVRGHVDLLINGSYWVGAAMGALLSDLLLAPGGLPVSIGWRLAFGLGATLGAGILLVRKNVPESPRWLLTHGRVREASQVVDAIEAVALAGAPRPPPPPPIAVVVRGPVGFRHLARVLLVRHRRRTVLGVALMTAQAFFYNAIFFTYGMILTRYYGVPDHAVGRYLLPFAAGNFLGPALLGRLFDRLGRKPMIVGTYAASGLLLAGTGLLFQRGLLGATGQTVCWCVTFFFASAAASSAYLTVSELFPVELRGMAIAHFYALATALGGPVATTVFGRIVEGGSRSALLAGYLVAGGLMVAAAAIAWRLAVPAEGRSLEELSGDQAAPA